MNKKLFIFAIHPIMYQTPIFRELDEYVKKEKIKLESKVYFGDDLSLREVYFKEINTVFKPDIPFLMEGYEYEFLKNYSLSSKPRLLSRINPAICRVLYREKYDAILVHGYDTISAWLAVFSSKLVNTKVIWRGEAVLRGNETKLTAKNLVKKVILRFFFKNCDKVLYSCTGNRKYLEYYGVKSGNMYEIPCAVNNFYFQNEGKKYDSNMTKRRLGITLEKYVVLFSARFTKRKRPLDLLRAIEIIDHEKIVVLFVGDGPERAEMEAYCKKNGIDAVFTGFLNQSKISEYYKISDLCIVVSEYDPSPKAMNEAMNFSVPVIVTDVVGTANDLVQDGENGYIVKVGNINQISKRIDELQKNRKKSKMMGLKSFEIVNQWNYKKDVKGIVDAVMSATN